MIVAVDIGNSNIVIGGIQGEEILFTGRIATERKKTEEQYAVEIRQILHLYGVSAKETEGSIISSVVPPLTTVTKKAMEIISSKRPLVVGPGLKTGLNIKIDNPAQLGSDLVVDAVAAIHQYPLPLIVIDMGTATTFSVINEKEEYIGGAIMPGLQISLDALSNQTSQLPYIDIISPKSVIGKNTIDCMNSGIVHGTAGMIDGIVRRIQGELTSEATIIATGGLAHLVTPYCFNKITQDKNLMLKGLKILYYKNCNRMHYSESV